MNLSIDQLKAALADVPTVCPKVIDKSVPDGDAELLLIFFAVCHQL
jgi:hypothetical protein